MRILLLFALLLSVLLFSGCVNSPVSDSIKLMADSAKKANAVDSYVLEYKRVVASYVDPNKTIHVVPATEVTKYKKGDLARWDTVDWLNNTNRLYKLGESYYSCSLNGTWSCGKSDSSKMQEFLGYNVLDPKASIERQISEGALLLGEVKNETILGRESRCLAIGIHPERFSEEDWKENVLGSAGKEQSAEFGLLMAWQCLDAETGIKTDLVLNYKGEVDGEMRTIEASLKIAGLDANARLDDSVFGLPDEKK